MFYNVFPLWLFRCLSFILPKSNRAITIDEAVQNVIIEKLKQAIVDNDMVATRALYNSVRFEKKELLEHIMIEIFALDYIVG